LEPVVVPVAVPAFVHVLVGAVMPDWSHGVVVVLD
jgi:hypothetical protein